MTTNSEAKVNSQYHMELALADFLDCRHTERFSSISEKYDLDFYQFHDYTISLLGLEKFERWNKFQMRGNDKTIRVSLRGVVEVIKPYWYTGAIKNKWIPRHHLLWCLHHEVTCVPPNYVIYHPQQNYSSAGGSEYTALTRSEHTKLTRKLRIANHE